MARDSILLTGAAGLVGEAVCRALLDAGCRVIAPWAPQRPGYAHPGLTWVECDLTERQAVQSLGPADATLHVAAAIPATLEDSAEAAAANRSIDANVIALCANRRMPLVYASSVTVYGQPGAGPLTESSPLRPKGAYAEEKAWAEREGSAALGRLGLTFTTLRLCAPYGPRQWRGSVIQMFIEQALDGGPLHYLGAGTREQSFTHVRDIARAFVLASSRGAGPGEVFNVTAPAPVTMRGLALMVARRAGLDDSAVQPANQPDPLEGAQARYDVQAAQRGLGWRPEIRLEDGVDECLRAEAERRTACR